MDQNGVEIILATLKDFSEAAEDVAYNLQKNDYKDEALNWEPEVQQTTFEVSHPTLHNLNDRLARFITTIIGHNDNLERNRHLSRENIQAVTDYLNVTQDKLTGAKFNRINIEPILDVVNEFENLNLLTESRRLRNIYNFIYGIRQWNQKIKQNPGTPIIIESNINYDEATPEELNADKGFQTFASLFKPSCNYTTAQKRALYNELKKQYTILDPKDADRTVMAVILLFRKPRSYYRSPFSVAKISSCKEKAMASFGRTISTIRSYTENSLTKEPTLGKDHVKRAETILQEALGRTR